MTVACGLTCTRECTSVSVQVACVHVCVCVFIRLLASLFVAELPPPRPLLSSPSARSH